MNRKYLLIGAIVLALALAGFFAVRTYASTGCFSDTNGLAAETFICWMKDKGITSGCGGGNYCPGAYVTRSQMAVFMKQAAEVPPTTGAILVAGGANNYVPLAADSTLAMTHYSNRLAITKPATGGEWIGLTPDMPVTLYGKSLQFVGVELCYKATANAYLSLVDVKTMLDSTSVGNYSTSFYDTTDRTDHTCRYFTLSTPLTLTSEHASIAFYLLIQWNVAGSPFELSRTTFVLMPTDTTAATINALDNSNVTILQEGSGGSENGDLAAP